MTHVKVIADEERAAGYGDEWHQVLDGTTGSLSSRRSLNHVIGSSDFRLVHASAGQAEAQIIRTLVAQRPIAVFA